MSLVYIKGYAGLEDLRDSIETKLKLLRQEQPDLDRAVEIALKQRQPKRGWINFIQLRILHQQFEGIHIPGLPTAVRTARFVVKRVKGLGSG